MSNDSKRVSQLGVTTAITANDRIMVLTNPGSGTANVQTIAASNFGKYIRANTGNIFFTTSSMYANGIDLTIKSAPNNYINIISNNYVQLHYNPDINADAGSTVNTSWAYVGDQQFVVENFSNGGVLTSGLYVLGVNTNIQMTANGNNWYFYGDGRTVFPGTISVGTSNAAANGFTSLPNGMKMNWGWVLANSSTGNVTFTSPYTTNAFSVTATSNTAEATYQAAVLSVNNTVAVIRTANDTSTKVMWTSIGY